MPNLDDKHVIDACAAPGGKTAHILEKYQPRKLIALDQDAKRLTRVTENLERLLLEGDHVEIKAADAITWQAPEQPDYIVLDAPCSAIGVMRRHPDIRLLRHSTDITQTVELQKQILENMWQQLKVGGTLLYITCSILKAKMNSRWSNSLANIPRLKKLKLRPIGALNRSMVVSCYLKPVKAMAFSIAGLKRLLK